MDDMIKSAKLLLPAEDIDMGGFKVKQALPTYKIAQVDPFLLLHHAKTHYSNLLPARHQGVDPHPHRGFSPITFVIEGELRHRDSHGNDQVARQGEIQWMHAGAGIVHSERPTDKLLENGGFQEIVQIWINSPSTNKRDIPSYQHYTEKDLYSSTSEDKLFTSKGIKNADRSPIEIYWVKGTKGGRMDFNVKNGFSTMIYLIKGAIIIKGFGLMDSEHLLIFEEEGEHIESRCIEDCEFLLLSGEAINEKVVQSGPYVMNSETEILEAIRDYQMGKMGILIED